MTEPNPRFVDDGPLVEILDGPEWLTADEGKPSASRAAGHDTTPGHDELHHYWTKGEGLAKWVSSPHPWTTLYEHLAKFPEVGPVKAKLYASRWFIEVFGFAAGSDKNRVAHGRPPRGKVVGPG